MKGIKHEDLVKFYFNSMKVRSEMFRKGAISMSEYNAWVLKAYAGLKRLGLKDSEAKQIISEVEGGNNY